MTKCETIAAALLGTAIVLGAGGAALAAPTPQAPSYDLGSTPAVGPTTDGVQLAQAPAAPAVDPSSNPIVRLTDANDDDDNGDDNDVAADDDRGTDDDGASSGDDRDDGDEGASGGAEQEGEHEGNF